MQMSYRIWAPISAFPLSKGFLFFIQDIDTRKTTVSHANVRTVEVWRCRWRFELSAWKRFIDRLINFISLSIILHVLAGQRHFPSSRLFNMSCHMTHLISKQNDTEASTRIPSTLRRLAYLSNNQPLISIIQQLLGRLIFPDHMAPANINLPHFMKTAIFMRFRREQGFRFMHLVASRHGTLPATLQGHQPEVAFGHFLGVVLLRSGIMQREADFVQPIYSFKHLVNWQQLWTSCPS